MSINMILPCVMCVIGFIVLCVVIYNITDCRSPKIKHLPLVGIGRESGRNMKEFDRITMDLSWHQYSNLKSYFYSSNISEESANTFLKSYRGMAFLKSYARSRYTDSIDEFKISQLILNAEKEEEIITCAVNVMKEHS